MAADGKVAVQQVQPVHGDQIVGDAGPGQIVQNLVVIDRVAGQEKSVAFVRQTDPAGRMAGQVQNGETAVAKVDPVAFGKGAGQGRGAQ